MALVFGGGQLVFFVLGLPLLVEYFLRRHKHELFDCKDHIPLFRYGLFYGAYKPERYFWEMVITIRKVSIVALAVFGPELGPELQALMALIVLLVCIVFEVYGDPCKIFLQLVMYICFCLTHIFSSPFVVPIVDLEESPRHRVLPQLEIASLMI